MPMQIDSSPIVSFSRRRPPRTPWTVLTATVLVVAVLGCSGYRRAATGERGFTILAINDVYLIEGADGGAAGGISRLRHLRAELDDPELLLFHAGDLLYPSLPSRLYDGAHMIDVLNLLDGDGHAFDDRMFVTFGNHEFDKDELADAAIVRARVAESQFTWLDTNIRWAAGDDGEPLVAADNLAASALVDAGGVRVGIFSLTTDFNVPAYASFRDPGTVARETTARLRNEGAEVVVALTHLGLEEDVALLGTLGDAGPDLIIGGHEHGKLQREVTGRWVLKADAEARSATVVRVRPRRRGPPRVSFGYRELDAAAPTDPDVDARVAEWTARTDREYCASIDRAPGCLAEVVGQTRVELVAEELEIRRYETNLGNFVVDQALAAFAGQGAEIAFFNSGSLRLNQDVPPGEVNLAHIEGIFQYPSDLVLLKLTGRVLQQIVDHAVTDWTGNGKWLQIAGFAFRHDPAAGTADRLTLLTASGPRPIAPDDEILAVTGDFVAGGGDGYAMLTPEMQVPVSGEPVPPLRELVIAALGAAGDEGIAPEVVGRICNTERPGPCLAVDGG